MPVFMLFVLNRVKLYKTTFIFDRGIGGGIKSLKEMI